MSRSRSRDKAYKKRGKAFEAVPRKTQLLGGAILIKHDAPTDVEHLHAPDFEKQEDVVQLSLLKDIEEGLNIALALELIDEIIKTKLTETNDADTQWGTDGPPYRGRDKAEPFGEPDEEEREPNMVGLP